MSATPRSPEQRLACAARAAGERLVAIGERRGRQDAEIHRLRTALREIEACADLPGTVLARFAAMALDASAEGAA